MNVIAFSNQKGGCGKTTTAINVAASLAALGQRTLLVDLDPQAHATFGLGIRSDKLEYTMYNVMTQGTDKRCFLERAILPLDTNLDLAPSHILLSTIEQEFAHKDESVSKLHEVLGSLTFPYDYVLIDCPPSLGFLTFNALRVSGTVIVPIELSSFSLMGVSKLISMIELIRVKMQHAPKVLALATMVDKRTRFSRYMLEQLQEAFGEGVLSSHVHRTVVVKESQAKGVPLLSFNAKCQGAIDHLLLTQEILTKVGADVSKSESEARLLPDRPDRRSLMKEFLLKGQGARDVHLVGDFNNWSINEQSRLWLTEEGVWQKRVMLDPGRYRYKYVIDGLWVNDPENNSFEPNPYGGVDSVLDIE